jgi:hypothetical protein
MVARLAVGKRWADDARLDTTKAVVDALSPDVQIPTTGLIRTRQGGELSRQGPWVHPRVAIYLVMWCSAEFAVQVRGWVEQWYGTQHHPLNDPLRVYRGISKNSGSWRHRYRPGGLETACSSKGTIEGQCSPIPPVIRGILINASGFSLDLGPHLGY